MLTTSSRIVGVMKEETFGPVIPIQKVSSDEEAVKLMNDSDLGLTASIWTRDLALGEKLCEDVEAGTVFVNRADYPSPVSQDHIPMLSADADSPIFVGPGLDRLERFRAWPNSVEVWI